MKTIEGFKGFEPVIQAIVDAINCDADPHAEGSAQTMTIVMPEGPQATVLILSGAQHDLIVEFVENNFKNAHEVYVS